MDITGIIHVGAHLCQDKQYYNQELKVPDDKILWIEADPLVASKARELYPESKIITALIGAQDGTKKLFTITNDNRYSSTTLPVLLSSQVAILDTLMLPTYTLDTVCELFNALDYNMLVVGTPGIKDEVLEGAQKVLESVKYIYSK